MCGNKLNSVTSVCSSNGAWFPPETSIKCEMLQCERLPDILHSYIGNITRVCFFMPFCPLVICRSIQIKRTCVLGGFLATSTVGKFTRTTNIAAMQMKLS